VDILGTFCDAFIVQCVKLMLGKFLLLWFLLFDCFVCRQNVTYLKRFTRYGHYSGEMENNRSHAELQLFLQSLCQKIERFNDAVLKKVVGFFVDTL